MFVGAADAALRGGVGHAERLSDLSDLHTFHAVEDERGSLFGVELVQDAAQLNQRCFGARVVRARLYVEITARAAGTVDQPAATAAPHFPTHDVHGDGDQVTADAAREANAMSV